MKINFKKIASVLTGAVMLSSTVAFAAAANFPAPFVKSAGGDVAIVYGSNAQATDFAAVVDVNSYLTGELAKMTTVKSSSSVGSSATITGEAAPLFSGSSKLYINDTLNAVKSVLTKTEMPVLLQDGTFSGNVDATSSQRIVLLGGTDSANWPQFQFAKEPTSSNDPSFGLKYSTTSANSLYNATVTFSKAVNLTHADSIGQELVMFGQKYTIAAGTTSTDLVLLKSAEKISLSTDNPFTKVTVGGKEYTVTLVSSSDTAATVKVEDSSGVSDTKEITENTSKKVQGLTVAVTAADENNLKLSATIIAGADKVTLTNGQSVNKGDNAEVVDGTLVTLTGGTTALTELGISVRAEDSDNDFIKPGASLVDPVFGSFKIDFPSLNIADTSADREDIVVKNSGDDKMTVAFTDSAKNAKTIQFARNVTGFNLQWDTSGHNITVLEDKLSYRGDYILVGNEDEGHLIKVSTVTNQTTGYSNDKVKFEDVMTGTTYEATLTAEGSGTATIGGKVYDVVYSGDSSSTEESRSVRLNYPDSSNANSAVLFPSIQTAKGAKIIFYQPTNINVSSWTGAEANVNLTTLKIPNGDSYTDIAFVNQELGNFSAGGTTLGNGTNGIGVAVGRLTYNFTYNDLDQVQVRVVNPQTKADITLPALIILEEKDDNSEYHGMIVTLEDYTSSSDRIGIDEVVRTWHADATWEAITTATDGDITKEADLYGSIITIDGNTADQKFATISYPDEQIYSLVYAAGVGANVDTGVVSSNGTATTSSSGVKVLGSVSVADKDVAQVSDKNLIVVGGSCVNKVAAELLGSSSPLCGAGFTAKTGVGAGSYLIQTFSRTSGKVATLVAGFDAADTTTAVQALKTQAIDTTAGKKYTGSTATKVEAVVAASGAVANVTGNSS